MTADDRIRQLVPDAAGTKLVLRTFGGPFAILIP